MARAPSNGPSEEDGEAGLGPMPVVAMPRPGIPIWLFALGAVVAAILLFLVLDGRRRAATEPAVSPQPADALATRAPPPALYVPPEPPPPAPPAAPPAAVPTVPPPPPQPQIVYVPQPAPPPIQPPPMPPAPAARLSSEPALVFDASAPRSAGEAAPAGGGASERAQAGGPAAGPSRVRAGVIANRSTTVPQGTLIPAVLETAFNSTRPGYARAIVSQDVRGFDGKQVLIPRGSRLIGDYGADVAAGQNRALVSWTRLIRPDGVTIGLASPASDPLGRGGVKARVNSHFLERFAGAILQSSLDFGVAYAASRVGNGAVLIAPLQGSMGQGSQPPQITPTLSIPQGTSISVFVARDLDFSGVEKRQ